MFIFRDMSVYLENTQIAFNIVYYNNISPDIVRSAIYGVRIIMIYDINVAMRKFCDATYVSLWIRMFSSSILCNNLFSEIRVRSSESSLNIRHESMSPPVMCTSMIPPHYI